MLLHSLMRVPTATLQVGSRVRAEVTVQRVSGTRIAFSTVCTLLDPPHTRFVDPAGGQLPLVIVDGQALALLQGWNPNEGDGEA